MGVILGWLIGLVVGYGILSWWLMLVLGAVHNDVFTWVPALGWWQSVLLLLLVSVLGSIWNLSNTLAINKD